jgi:hypothetical protein
MVKESLNPKPFPVGIFCGTSKPHSVDEFLHPLVNDLKTVANGIVHAGITYNVIVGPVICNAPPRVFIKCVKGHSGFFGCERCEQEGEYINGRVTFPETTARKRTDADFHQLLDNGHHLSESSLACLKVGMVTSFST